MANYENEDARDIRCQLGWRNSLRNLWRRSRTAILIAGVAYVSYQCGKTEGVEDALASQASAIEKIVSSYDASRK